LPPKPRQSAVAKLALVQEKAKGALGELHPIPAAGEAGSPAPTNEISVPRSAASFRPLGKEGIGSIISA
jgi:hypothetical protein